MALLVGVGHKKRRGKDTIANRLVDKHGFMRVSWADPMKEAAGIIFDWDYEHLYGDLKEVIDPRWGFSPRWAIIRFGTEACRDNIDKNIWVKSTWFRIQKIWKKNPNMGIVVPDVRFPNEAAFIREKGGVLWRVDRDIPPDENSSHESEVALDSYDDWDVIIQNNSDLAHLYGMTDAALEQAKAPPKRRNERGTHRRSAKTNRST